jgi:hypothetical protein
VVFEQAKMAEDEGLSMVKHSKSSNHPISFLHYNGSSLCEIFIGFSRYGATRRGVEHLGVMLNSPACVPKELHYRFLLTLNLIDWC